MYVISLSNSNMIHQIISEDIVPDSQPDYSPYYTSSELANNDLVPDSQPPNLPLWTGFLNTPDLRIVQEVLNVSEPEEYQSSDLSSPPPTPKDQIINTLACDRSSRQNVSRLVSISVSQSLCMLGISMQPTSCIDIKRSSLSD